MEAKEFFELYESKEPNSLTSLVARHAHQYLRSKSADHQFDMDDAEQVLSMLAAKGAVVYELLPTLRQISLTDIYLSHRREVNNSIINEVVIFSDPEDTSPAMADEDFDFNMYEVITTVTRDSLYWSARSMYTYWGYVKQALRNGKDWRL